MPPLANTFEQCLKAAANSGFVPAMPAILTQEEYRYCVAGRIFASAQNALSDAIVEWHDSEGTDRAVNRRVVKYLITSHRQAKRSYRAAWNAVVRDIAERDMIQNGVRLMPLPAIDRPTPHAKANCNV